MSYCLQCTRGDRYCGDLVDAGPGRAGDPGAEESAMSLFYRDVVTNKIRWTKAVPVAVTRDGLLGVEGLKLEQPRTGNILWIPKYLLVGAAITHFWEIKRRQGEEVTS